MALKLLSIAIQVVDYAARKKIPVDEAQRWLSPMLK